MTETAIATQPKDRRALSVTNHRLSEASGFIDSILMKLMSFQSERNLGSLCVGFTSSNRKVGVSTVAHSLALNAAANGVGGILLVDVNAENPCLHQLSKQKRGPGLVDHLVRGETLENCVRKIAEPDVSLLMWGSSRIPPSAISPFKLDGFFSDLRTRYQLIVLDLPPIEDVGYGLSFATYTDGIVMVLDGGVSRNRSVVQTLEHLKECQVEVIGSIMNRFRSPLPNWLKRWF